MARSTSLTIVIVTIMLMIIRCLSWLSAFKLFLIIYKETETAMQRFGDNVMKLNPQSVNKSFCAQISMKQPIKNMWWCIDQFGK